MNRSLTILLTSVSVFALLLFAVTLSVTAGASDNDSVTVTAADHAATRSTRNQHLKPANTPLGRLMRGAHQNHSATLNESKRGGASDQERFPGDVQFHGGQVVVSAESHAIYLRPSAICPTVAVCWGDPEGFLRAFAESDLSHVLDQYAGSHADNRYTLGAHKFIAFSPSKTPLTDMDIQGYVHAVAAKTGEVGYGHIYHVFLPPGTDECFDSTFQQCYSPDNLASFAFCAYHNSVDFKDIGHVLYSVEPYQNVLGCQDIPGTPNGQLVDSQNDTLSHELSETISDPDGDAWWNSVGLGMIGQEIGDECIFITPDGFSIPNLWTVDGKKYATQPEYSNQDHGCNVAP